MTSGPIPSPGRRAIRRGRVDPGAPEPGSGALDGVGSETPDSATVELPPCQVEQVLEELLHAPGRERPPVLRGEPGEQRGLALVVAQRNAVGLLVVVETADEL